MQILTDVPFSTLTTMRLGGPARFVMTAETRADIARAVDWADEQQLPILVLGEGSNMIVRDDGFKGLVLLNRIKGLEVVAEDETSTTIKIAAGENWDEMVARTVEMGLSGIEALSLIPGTAGATPVQNVGAYGQEISQTLISLEAFDLELYRFVTLSNAECLFSYRSSRFKSLQDRRFIIAAITLRLSKGTMQPPFYASLQRYLDEHHITNYSPKTIRKAVIAVREKNLPDPKKIANTGSFFKNPVVSAQQAAKLHKEYPDMPQWPTQAGSVKLPAGWLLEKAGLKGYKAHGMETYAHNALVFVNQDAKHYHELAAFQQEVAAKVEAQFGILLEQEPELL